MGALPAHARTYTQSRTLTTSVGLILLGSSCPGLVVCVSVRGVDLVECSVCVAALGVAVLGD